MSHRNTLRSRRGGLPPALTATGILVVALVGGVLLLHATGVIDIPALSGGDDGPPRIDMRGKVLVPIAARAIPAYTAVGREHIFDVRSGTFSTYAIRKDNLPPGAMLTQMDVLGRVLRHDKPAGMMFVEKDFYPKGTRPGPTAGVPPGKRALRLKASAVPGLHGLRQGDRFDIVMTSEVEIEDPPTRPSAHRAPRVDLEGPYASMQQAEMDAPPPPPAPVVKRKQADVQVVVEDGVLVQPIQERNEIETQASLLRGTSLRKKPIEELIIAVRPGEVAALNRAMAVGAHLQVAMRSGQVSPKDADPGHIPDLIVDPQKVRPQPEAARDGPAPSRFRMVEVITGGTKELISIPREKRGAAQAAHATK